MAMYVRHTRSVQLDELPAHIRGKLADHAESRQIQLNGVRAWLTHSENPPASSGLGKLLRRRANSADPDDEHCSVLVLHQTQIMVVVDGAKRGTSALSLPLAQASVADDAAGFTLTGLPGEQIGSFFVGLGPEAAATECFSAVRSAITAAKNPTG
jgi:hypothetical protein